MIRWVPYDGRGYRGYALWQSIDSPDNKYWAGRISGNPKPVADVFDFKKGDWYDFDHPFDTVEEAMQWCEAVEATGAY